ncbi:hypothetical protein [Dinghuibacter silviterrae]|uniref:Uncharacterized protein n=1 Tax=Dinghuibacter silviterrae TaxID=1539049 RepID=A0A4R8DTG7_9BACT|nr:hypothetical protein [Dinghuibacter silviterrae]TDX01580.1 hypothetical protein EDB95_2620 [Dinghuibacter silviterrae]
MSTIRLAYRQIIDASATGAFEQEVWYKTHAEFRIQQQSFAKGLPLHTWDDIQFAFPKAKPALPFKLSFALSGAMQKLGGLIPGLKDPMGDEVVPYHRYVFDLLASDAREIKIHKVSLTWFSQELTLHRAIADHLLLSYLDRTFLLRLQDRLSIVSYVSEPDTKRIENGQFFGLDSL